MEKFFLCRFLTDNKLDIIDEEDVVVSVFFTELRGGNIVFVPDRIDQFVRKLLTCNVENLRFWIVFKIKCPIECINDAFFPDLHPRKKRGL